MIVRAIEDAERLGYEVGDIVQLVAARRESAAKRALPLEDLHAEIRFNRQLEAEMARCASMNATVARIVREHP